MIWANSPMRNSERSLERSAVALAVAHETASLARRREKGVPRAPGWSSLRGRWGAVNMADDDVPERPASGLVVLGWNHPRIVDGVDTYTGERLGPEDLTPEEAEARSVENRRQRAESIFADPKWTVDWVLSWIGYRDIQAIEVPFKPKLYKDSRPTVEGAPRLMLLRALRDDDLRAIRHRSKVPGRVPIEEWFLVEDQWPVDVWPECAFASAEVRAMWPPIPDAAEQDPLDEAPGPEVEKQAEHEPAIAKLQAYYRGPKGVHVDKAAFARQGAANRKAKTRRIVWEQVEMIGRSDLDPLLAAVRAEQSKKNIHVLCTKRVLKDILRDGPDVFERSSTETSEPSVS